MSKLDCGCHIETKDHGSFESPEVHRTIVFCRLHEAAMDLVRACQTTLITLNINRKYISAPELQANVRAALKKAGFDA